MVWGSTFLALFIGESLSVNILTKVTFALLSVDGILALHWGMGNSITPLTWGLAAVAFLYVALG